MMSSYFSPFFLGYGTETPLMRFNLESISSEPKEQFTFIIPYDQLIEKTQQIVKKACTGNYNYQHNYNYNRCLSAYDYMGKINFLLENVT